jgi:sporulation and spore germination protein
MKKLALVLIALAGCGGDDDTLTVYLKQRLGPEGPHSQIAPVLMPVERERRGGVPEQHQAVLEVRVGPSPDERAHGFLDTVEPETRLRSVVIEGDTATVELLGREPDFYGAAAIVYSLTALPGVEQVALRLGGEPCCKYRHDGTVVALISRRSYAGWQGEPCDERDEPDAVRCRG